MNDYKNVNVHTPDALAKKDAEFNTVSTVGRMLKNCKRQIEESLKGQLDANKFTIVAMTLIRTNPDLQKCTPESIVTGVIMAANRGLSLDPTLGHAYLVPYWNSKIRTFEAQYQTGYKGKIFLAKQDGIIVDTFVVYENDFFEITRTESKDTMTYKPCSLTKDPGDSIGWVARARLDNGTTMFEVMRRSDMDKIRESVKAKYKGKDTPAWRNWFDEQGRGKVVNRMANYLPQAGKLQEDAAHENAVDFGDAEIISVTENGETVQIAVPRQEEKQFENKPKQIKEKPKPKEEPNDTSGESQEQGGLYDELLAVAKDKWGDKWKEVLTKTCKAHGINSAQMSDKDVSKMLDVLID
jgi:recombination protein RecT